MSAEIVHRLVGYDPLTGDVAVEHDVPLRQIDYAKAVAGVGPDDPQAALCYRLDARHARDLADAIGAHIDPDRFAFFLEGFAAQ